MKKITTLLLSCLLMACIAKAQYVNIPDSNFAKYLMNKLPICVYHDSSNLYWMDTTCNGVVSTDSLTTYYNIQSGTAGDTIHFEGLEYFKNLKYLYIEPMFHVSTAVIDNNVLPNSIQTLQFGGLRNIIFNTTHLPDSLKMFVNNYSSQFSGSNVVFPSGFNYFNYSSTRSTDTWINGNTYPSTLETFKVSNLMNYSPLTTLPTGLKTFELNSCWGVTDFSYMNLPAGLQNLSFIDANSAVNTSTIILPKLPAGLTSLSLINTKTLCLPLLPDSLQTLDITGASVSCISKLPNSYLSITPNTPVCNSTNNSNSCTIYNNYVNIPDSNFAHYLTLQIPSCLYKDSNNLYWMDTTCSGVLSLDSINCSSLNIKDLTGFQYFKNLTYIDCSVNSITSLPSIPIRLNKLIIPYNPIASLPTLPSSLYLLGVWSTNIHCLPILPDSLTVLSIDSSISCLPNRPAGLTVYSESSPYTLNIPVCNNNNNPNGCNVYGVNNYVNIPDSNFAKYLITQIPSCLYKDSSNQYWMDTTSSGVLSLDSINCSSLNIKDLTGFQYFKNLTYIDCSVNSITSLPAIPIHLNKLIVPYNPIASLPALPSSLYLLGVWSTNIHCLPILPDSLIVLSIDSSISCLPNRPAGLTVYSESSPYTLNIPVCNASNNPNSCTVYGINNQVNIPDSNFAKYLITQIPSCLYKDSSNQYWMDTTCSGVTGLTYLNVASHNISNITGIQYFKRLNAFYCDHNQLTSLSQLPDSIVTLKCSFNNLTSITQFPNALNYLYCDNNRLTNLSNLPANLLFMSCEVNDLTSLPSLPSTLTEFHCNNNLLTSITALPNSLNYLLCSTNKLTSLPALPNSLTRLHCDYNLLTNLPTLSAGLQELYCNNNQLNSLSSLPNNLNTLTCGYNPIVSIPALNNSLQTLDCSNTLISYLPSLPSTIQILQLFRIPNMHCLPVLPASLGSLYINNSAIRCIPNIVSGLTIYDSNFTQINMPVCNATNNLNQCQAFPIVYGKVYTDVNSNGIKDSNEYYRPFVQLNLNTGKSVITNTNGGYDLKLDSSGSYTLTTVAPAGFNAVPASNNFTFNANNASLTLPDIALQPIANSDSLTIFITPFNSKAKPGKAIAYLVTYENDGNKYQTDNISVTYDTSKMQFDSSNVSIISHIGNTIVVSNDSLFPGIYKYFFLYFTVKTTATFTDSIWANATISSPSSFDSWLSTIAVSASYDPNSKEATPEITPLQVTKGTFIDYTIRFQNTGNDTAYTVVLADTLSTLLQSNIIQMVASSHPCNIVINNGIIYFEFKKINLPDSNKNKLMSNGFVHFRIKPIANASLSTNIDNKASIYFDYNRPVLTNVASTIIKPYGLPVILRSYNATLYINKEGVKPSVFSEWITSMEINASHYIVQKSIDGNSFNAVGKVLANASSLYTFTDVLTNEDLGKNVIYYRLQMVDKDGRTSYSETKAIYLKTKSSEYNVFPNPAKNYFIVEGSNISVVNFIDNVGKIISRYPINNAINEHKIMFNLNTGIYLAQIVLTDGSIVNKKLMVQ